MSTPNYFTDIAVPENTLSNNFSSDVLANIEDLWSEIWHPMWEPVYKEDLKLNSGYDFLKTIVNRVKDYNESYDITVVGDRGLGKSAFGLGMAILLNKYFNGPKSQFDISRVCFSVDEWAAVCGNIKGGGVVILDEIGTSGSLSSRESMSKGNRAASDIIQLMRTDRIITIYISTDRDRIDKRVRQLTSVMSTPLAKLSNVDTNGFGLAVEADVKFRRTRPANESFVNKHTDDDSGYLQHEVMPLSYASRGNIYSIVIPHAPEALWDQYEIKRANKLEEVRTKHDANSADNIDTDDILFELKQEQAAKKKTRGRPKK
jgi:hypothetical protein